MRKVLTILLMLCLTLQLWACQNSTGGSVNISSFQINTEYQPVEIKGEKNISPENHTFATVSIDSKTKSDANFLYNLVSYDSNGVQQLAYQDINISTDDKIGKVSCKVVPNGHFTLEVKNENSSSVGAVDITILLE